MAAPESYVPALRFDRLTRVYDPLVRLTTRERTFKDRLLDQAEIGATDRVLDLGCGTGTLAIQAKQRHPQADPPSGPLMALLSVPIRLGDGPEPTRDNFNGNLPGILAAGGLEGVRERSRLRSALGSIVFYAGRAGR